LRFSGQLEIQTRIVSFIHIIVFSIENFYWILYENLLKSSKIDAWYYYPFGTQDRFVWGDEFKIREPKQEHHALFYFDQEYVRETSLPIYDSGGDAWRSKICKILANSEHSLIKREICKKRDMLDWYFFYHGFAALDWYRDARYIDQDVAIENAFLSLNHVFHGRSYRLDLLARMLNKNIVHKGSISFHATLEDVVSELRNPDSCISDSSRIWLTNNIDKLSNLPWKLDDIPINGNLSARFGHNEHRLWQRSLLHVVNETVFSEPKLHLTEKVFKPIVAQRPFILAAPPGNLAYLRSYGFRTFDHWIDESYDMIQDPAQRLDAIAGELARFAHMRIDELKVIHRDMLPVLQYNKQHFFGKFREIIVSELVDNFDTCLRIWNNGRVDGRELPLHPDLNSVKQILLR